MSDNATTTTATKPVKITERITFGPMPPQYIPEGEKPQNVLILSYESECGKFSKKSYSGTLDALDMEVRRKFTVMEYVDEFPGSEVVIENA